MILLHRAQAREEGAPMPALTTTIKSAKDEYKEIKAAKQAKRKAQAERTKTVKKLLEKATMEEAVEGTKETDKEGDTDVGMKDGE